MTERLIRPRLLADENTSHRLVSACRRLVKQYPIVHIADWRDGSWLGLDDAALLMSCARETGRLLPSAIDSSGISAVERAAALLKQFSD